MLSIQNSNKDILAKLMATENITVLHKKVPTAYFDVKARTLVCPMLKDDMSSEMYDLFMGHEVGHALNTPLEGWHNAVCEKGPVFKGYLNVIEDCRIEKMIKSKYPGLRKSFYTGYNELAIDNFFGIKGKDLSKLILIDKINIHFKIGAQARVKFTDEERPYIKRCLNLTTFEEVMELASELFDLQKQNTEDELKSMTQDQLESLMDDLGIEDTSEENASEEDASETMAIEVEGEDGQNSESPFIPEDGEKSEEPTKESQGGGEEDENDSPSDSSEEGGKSGGKSAEEQIADELNKSETDEEYRKKEGQLHNDDRYEREPTYYELTDKIKYENFVVPWTETNELFNDLNRTNIKKYVNNFVTNNKKIVNYMVKEFEMKKAAAAYNRSWGSKTGELNMDKLHLYKLKDDIFNRIQVIPEGKNHGVVMILDWSGSMYGSVKPTMEC